MAWNPSPEVAAARDCAKALKANVGVVVIYLNTAPDRLGMASYGATKDICGGMGKLGDHLLKAAEQFFEEPGDATDGVDDRR